MLDCQPRFINTMLENNTALEIWELCLKILFAVVQWFASGSPNFRLLFLVVGRAWQAGRSELLTSTLANRFPSFKFRQEPVKGFSQSRYGKRGSKRKKESFVESWKFFWKQSHAKFILVSVQSCPRNWKWGEGLFNAISKKIL